MNRYRRRTSGARVHPFLAHSSTGSRHAALWTAPLVRQPQAATHAGPKPRAASGHAHRDERLQSSLSNFKMHMFVQDG